MSTVVDGVIIGGAGGAIAGLTISLVRYLHTKTLAGIHKNRVYSWLSKNTKDEDGHRYRSSRAVASWNNLTEDRVRYVCSIHGRIYLSTGEKEDRWSLYGRGDRSVYEDRGIKTA